jgi:hypothetical protein
VAGWHSLRGPLPQVACVLSLARSADDQASASGLLVPDVVRRFVERGVPELLVAGLARHPYMPHAAAKLGSLPRRRADTGFPADSGQAGPQLVTERAALWLVFENRHGHGAIMPSPARGHAGRGPALSPLSGLVVTGLVPGDDVQPVVRVDDGDGDLLIRVLSDTTRPLGNSIESMDLGFALQARCLEAVANRSVDATSCVVPVPGRIDAAVANSYLDRKYPPIQAGARPRK